MPTLVYFQLLVLLAKSVYERYRRRYSRQARAKGVMRVLVSAISRNHSSVIIVTAISMSICAVFGCRQELSGRST